MFCVPIRIFRELRLCFLAVNLVFDFLAGFENPGTTETSISMPSEKAKATERGGVRGQRATHSSMYHFYTYSSRIRIATHFDFGAVIHFPITAFIGTHVITSGLPTILEPVRQ